MHLASDGGLQLHLLILSLLPSGMSSWARDAKHMARQEAYDATNIHRPDQLADTVDTK